MTQITAEPSRNEGAYPGRAGFLRLEGWLGAQQRRGLLRPEAGLIGLLSQCRVEVAQVLMGEGIAWTIQQGPLERLASPLRLSIAQVEHGQVVMGLGEFGELVDEVLQAADGLRILPSSARRVA